MTFQQPHPIPGVTEQELQALLSQKDLTTSFAENLLKQFENEDVDVKDSKLLEAAAAQSELNNNNRSAKSPPIKCEATSTSVLLKKYEIKSEPVIKIEKLMDYDAKPKFTTKMTSKEIYTTVKWVCLPCFLFHFPFWAILLTILNFYRPFSNFDWPFFDFN